MILARLTGHSDEALALARKSAESLEKFTAGKGDTLEASAILNTYLNVADQYRAGQQFDEALRLCGRASELARTFGSRAQLGNFLWVLANTFRDRGDLDAARNKIGESVGLLDPGPNNTEHGQTHNFILALIYQGRILGRYNAVSLGRFEEAAASLKRAFDIADGFAHRDLNDQSSRGNLAMAAISLADILLHSDAGGALGRGATQAEQRTSNARRTGCFRDFRRRGLPRFLGCAAW